MRAPIILVLIGMVSCQPINPFQKLEPVRSTFDVSGQTGELDGVETELQEEQKEEKEDQQKEERDLSLCQDIPFNMVKDENSSTIDLTDLSRPRCPTQDLAHPDKTVFFIVSNYTCGYCNLLVQALDNANYLQNNPDHKIYFMMGQQSYDNFIAQTGQKYLNYAILYNPHPSTYDFLDKYWVPKGSYPTPSGIRCQPNRPCEFFRGMCEMVQAFTNVPVPEICNP